MVPDRDESEGLPRLRREVFDRPATDVAPELLGCILWHDSPVGLVAVRLVEVEAYRGAIDAASHAFRGRTARNAVMFGPPGHAYVYFSYGMHYCVNLVCEPAGRGEAVLIRAGAVVAGAQLAGHRRYGDAAGSIGSRGRQRELDLARGPGRLCQALGIDLSLDGADVCDPGGTLGISPPDAFDQPATAPARVVLTGPRVGISRAAELPWRYWLAEDRHVSGYRTSKPRAGRPRAGRPRAGQPKPVAGRVAEDGTMHK